VNPPADLGTDGADAADAGASPRAGRASPWAPPAAPRRGPPLGPGNRLLAALPRLDLALLAREFEPIGFAPGQSLRAPGQPIGRVVFPDSGVISLVAEPADGERAEVGLVGREGLLGLPALLGQPEAGLRWLVRVGGGGRAIRADALRARMLVSYALRDLLHRCTAAGLAEARQGAACTALHPLPRRLAGRLLALEDRMGPGFALSQASLAETLNARRPTVSTELQGLRRAGLIRQARGRIAIADRRGLEALACPCHAAAREARRRLLPPGLGGHGDGAR
jgi:CRP-like cAMP-binding protein